MLTVMIQVMGAADNLGAVKCWALGLTGMGQVIAGRRQIKFRTLKVSKSPIQLGHSVRKTSAALAGFALCKSSIVPPASQE